MPVRSRCPSPPKWLQYADHRSVPLLRAHTSRSGSITPITKWLQYADHEMAPMCRSVTHRHKDAGDGNEEASERAEAPENGARIVQILRRTSTRPPHSSVINNTNGPTGEYLSSAAHGARIAETVTAANADTTVAEDNTPHSGWIARQGAIGPVTTCLCRAKGHIDTRSRRACRIRRQKNAP